MQTSQVEAQWPRTIPTADANPSQVSPVHLTHWLHNPSWAQALARMVHRTRGTLYLLLLIHYKGCSSDWPDEGDAQGRYGEAQELVCPLRCITLLHLLMATNPQAVPSALCLDGGFIMQECWALCSTQPSAPLLGQELGGGMGLKF